MKSRLQLFAIILLAFCSLYAQSPEGFNYQAVIRNTAGEVLSNQSVGIRMTLIQGAANGSVVYRETFTKTTNSFGLIDLIVGQGSATTGSFSTIDWSAGPYFIETAIDQNGGSNYSVLGTSQLMSVPFAMYAASSASDGADGQDGADGKSSYEIWIEAGNSGSEAEFLASLVGEAGPAGADGADGQDGSGLTPSIQAEIDANTAKVGITTEQANAILTNSADPDVDETNEIQTLSISDDQLSLSNGGGSITLPSSVDNSITNELQTISRADEFVVLSNSGGIASIEDDDADPANELQTISRADEFVVLSNSGGMASVEDDDADPANEIQILSISDDQLSLSNGGGTVTIPTSTDNSTTNELNTSVALNGTDLEVTDAGGTISADLSSLTVESDPVFVASDASAIAASDIANWNAVHSAYDSNGGFDDADADPENELQEISTDATPGNIAITDGATLTLNVEDTDADPANEIQDLQLIDNTIRLTNNVNATSISIGMHAYGDVKNSFKNSDHDGWFLLDGRAISSLPEVAQANANIFFSGNIPDATNRFLKANDGSQINGDLGGSNLIGQNNIPNYNLTGTTSSDGAHNHGGFTQDESDDGISNQGAHQHGFDDVRRANSTATVNHNIVGGATTGVQNNNSNGTVANSTNAGGGAHFHAIATSSNHSHSVTTNSGGSGEAYYQPYLVTNVFVYLGGTSLSDLQALGNTTQEILDTGISPFSLWSDDNSILSQIVDPANPTTPIATYNNAGVSEPITLQVLVDQGISLADLFDVYGTDLLSNTTVNTLTLSAVVSIETMSTAGVPLSEMLADGIAYSDLIASVYTHQDLKDNGVSVADFIAASFDILEIDTNTDFTLTELRAGGYSISELLSTGYTHQQIKDDGVTVAEFFGAGVTTADLLLNTDYALTNYTGAGVAIADLYGAFPLQELKDEFTASDLLTVSSIQELLDDTDITIQELRSGGAPAEDFHGISFGGGLIFATAANGDTFIASLSDQSSGVRWANDGTANASGSGFYSGMTNTSNILAFDDGSVNGPNAATVCAGNINGFSDWFLPSRDELEAVYNNLFDKSAFIYDNTAIYWSSTAVSTSNSAGIDFADGSLISGSQRDRANTYNVRAIRFIPGN